jgi:hypothetical protein
MITGLLALRQHVTSQQSIDPFLIPTRFRFKPIMINDRFWPLGVRLNDGLAKGLFSITKYLPNKTKVATIHPFFVGNFISFWAIPFFLENLFCYGF